MKQHFIKLATGLLYILLSATVTTAQNSAPEVQIHYLGHSSFILRFDNGVTIVTDYGHENAWKEWGWDDPIYSLGSLLPDVMTYSHKHEDHYDAERIPEGVKYILTDGDSLELNGIVITPIGVCEKELNMVDNYAYLFQYKGLRILHLADAQREIQNISVEAVKKHMQSIIPDSLDLLFMTIEGPEKFIPEAEAFVELLKPKRIIPMHYWSNQYKLDFIDYCLKNNNDKKNYVTNKHEDSEYQLFSSDAVSPVKIIILEPGEYSRK